MQLNSHGPRLALALLLAPLALAGLLLFLSARVSTSGKDARHQDFIVGRVCERDRPLAGATVRLKGSSESVRTDAAGRFRLPRGKARAGRVTAWKDGYFIGGRPLDIGELLLRLERLPGEDYEGYEWVDPAPDPRGEHNCANCHGEIYREWERSGHARSATGPHFRSLYLGTDWKGKPGVGWGLLTQYPDGSGVCTACHAPTVRPGDPAQLDLGKVKGVAAKGVHCDYCHKVSGHTDDEVGLAHGRDGLTLLRPREGQLFFGPLDDVDRGEDAYSAFYKDSRYCASCHEGIVFGVHVYSTYSEWRDSPAGRAGRHCQDCHMRPTGTMTNIAPGKGGMERDPWTLASHRFFTGSREEMLRRCLQVAAVLQHRPDGVRAEVSLRADGAGHRVPTGFIDRHLLLVAEGFDHAGRPVGLRSGPVLPAAAGPELAGRPGRLYARLLRDRQGRSPAPFWLAHPDPPADTRLHPGRPDRLVLDFPPALHRLRVRVIYRRFWQEVARTKGWPEEDVIVVDRTFSPRTSAQRQPERPPGAGAQLYPPQGAGPRPPRRQPAAGRHGRGELQTEGVSPTPGSTRPAFSWLLGARARTSTERARRPGSQVATLRMPGGNLGLLVQHLVLQRLSLAWGRDLARLPRPRPPPGGERAGLPCPPAGRRRAGRNPFGL